MILIGFLCITLRSVTPLTWHGSFDGCHKRTLQLQNLACWKRILPSSLYKADGAPAYCWLLVMAKIQFDLMAVFKTSAGINMILCIGVLTPLKTTLWSYFERWYRTSSCLVLWLLYVWVNTGMWLTADQKSAFSGVNCEKKRVWSFDWQKKHIKCTYRPHRVLNYMFIAFWGV